MEWWLGILVMLGVVSLFTIERRLGALLRQFVLLQRKIDLVLEHLGVEQVTPLSGISANVQEIASDPSRKIEAIKVHRDETGASLKEAKDAVEKWMREKNVS